MKKIEAVFSIITLIAIILRFMLFPGASELLAIAGIILAFIYAFFSFALLNNIRLRNVFINSAYNELSAKKIIASVFIGFSISSIIIGAIFRLLLFLGATEMLVFGLVPLAISTLIIAFLDKSSYQNIKQYYLRIIPAFALGFSMYFISELNMIKIIFREYPDYVNASIKAAENPTDKELQRNADEEWEKMQQAEYERIIN